MLAVNGDIPIRILRSDGPGYLVCFAEGDSIPSFMAESFLADVWVNASQYPLATRDNTPCPSRCCSRQYDPVRTMPQEPLPVW